MSSIRPSPTRSPAPELASVVERNIAALLRRRQEEDARKGWPEKVADAVTRFTGSMRFVIIHLVLFGSWIIANLPGIPLPKFDPTYVMLAMWASVEAIFLSTFVLISQNRTATLQDRRADLDLQVSLLAEHELTQLITLVRAMAAKLDVAEAQSSQLVEAERNVAPEKVLDAMARHDPSPTA